MPEPEACIRSGVDIRPALELLQRHVGGCREWLEHDRCGAPAEYVLWGKLYDKEGLGPRCHEHAQRYASSWGLATRSGHALINLSDLAYDIAVLGREAPVATALPTKRGDES